MNFEFDEQKSVSNQQKHGIDFIAAQSLWSDPERIVFEATTSDEVRYIMVAKMRSKFWSAIYTIRHDKIRIISVRRSRKEEVEQYES